MNILITGAKGFVGKNLAANLYCIKDGKTEQEILQSMKSLNMTLIPRKHC